MWFGFRDPRIVNLGGVVYLLASFRNKDCISQMCLFVLEGTHVTGRSNRVPVSQDPREELDAVQGCG